METNINYRSAIARACGTIEAEVLAAESALLDPDKPLVKRAMACLDEVERVLSNLRQTIVEWENQ